MRFLRLSGAILLVILLAGALPRVVPLVAGAAPLEEGITLYQQGQFAEALARFQQAVRADPKMARAWVWLGATHLKLGQIQEAIRALTRAVDLDGRLAPAHFFLGIAYARLGDLDRARAAFTRVRVLAPDTPYAETAAAWLSALASEKPAPIVSANPPTIPGPAASCPKPPVFPGGRAPTTPRVANSIIQISSVEFALQKEELLVAGEIENDADRDVQGVRVGVTGVGLDGRQVARVEAVLAGRLESDDFREFQVRLPTRPPPIWVQVQVLDYGGRRASESLHGFVVPVDVETYEGLAPGRVKVAATVQPAGPAMSHTVCLSIADPAGFPVDAVVASVVVEGDGGVLRQTRTVEVSAEGASIRIDWNRPVQARAQVQVQSVTFGGVPRGR